MSALRWKVAIALLVVLLGWLQYRLWLGQGGLMEVYRLRQQIEAQNTENLRLRERNAALEAEVRDLKQGLDAIEERARAELGMIRRDETFHQVVENPDAAWPAKAPKATGQ